jgi:DNA-binding NarL/FixJ family response regulator
MNQVLLIDDTPLFRLGLRELVKAAQPVLACSEAESFAVARAILRQRSDIALIMLNIKLPDCGGFVGLFQLRNEFPGIPIVILSNSANAELVSRAVAFGAAGFILKSAPCDAVLQTLKTILSGQTGPMPIISNADQASPVASLSPALVRVMLGVKRGLRNKEIAFELGLSEKTIKAYLGILYRKLGVSNRTQAVILLQEVLVEQSIDSVSGTASSEFSGEPGA